MTYSTTNPNYCAIISRPTALIPLPNCTNVQHAVVCGSKVIVGMDTALSQLGVFFPTETALSHEFLSANSLYVKPEYGNIDPSKKGYFEKHGRVRAVKFRGYVSDGFWIPLTSLINMGFVDVDEFTEGLQFDHINDTEICRKYVPHSNRRTNPFVKQPRRERLEDGIVAGQFKFHPDTINLRRVIDKIQPNDVISITDKWHGTSIVVGNLLTTQPLRWWERALIKLGVSLNTQSYKLVWSSRKVIKGVGDTAKQNVAHYYDQDVWGEVAQRIKHLIPKGYTVYGEIVGYTSTGSPIQGGYTYGCPPSIHRLMIYRVTSTNSDGEVIELSWPQLKEFCTQNGLEHVKELYYGPPSQEIYSLARDKGITLSEAMLEWLEVTYVRGQDCEYNPGLPAEGIVVRVDHLDHCDSYKLKNFRFLEHETKLLDANAIDIETNESNEDQVNE